MAGVSRKDILGKRLEDSPLDAPSKVFALFAEAIRTRRTQRLEWNSDGLHKWYEAVVVIPRPGYATLLLRDVTETIEYQRSLKKYSTGLEEANTQLQQFAYVVSHDLREPLRMITSFSQMLEQKLADKLGQSGKDYLRYILGGTARMHSLIDGILEYSRVSTHARPFEEVDMNNVLHDVLMDLKVSIEESNAKITHDPLSVVTADPVQMNRVLQNLISNAIKFRHRDVPPAVHVSCRLNSKWVFSVRDNGIGIEPKAVERLFHIFSRLHGQDEYPGTGMGLAIVKRIVERHGGQTWVDSFPDKGSTFYFSLPRTG